MLTNDHNHIWQQGVFLSTEIDSESGTIVTTSFKQLSVQALVIARRLGLETFKASQIRLSRWKCRWNEGVRRRLADLWFEWHRLPAARIAAGSLQQPSNSMSLTGFGKNFGGQYHQVVLEMQHLECTGWQSRRSRIPT